MAFYDLAYTGAQIDTRLGYASQNVGTGASPTFVGLTLSGLTASKMLTTNGSKALATVYDVDQSLAEANSPTFVGLNLSGLTASRMVTTDASKNLATTLQANQNVHTGASPTFVTMYLTNTLVLSGLTASKMVTTDASKNLVTTYDVNQSVATTSDVTFNNVEVSSVFDVVSSSLHVNSSNYGIGIGINSSSYQAWNTLWRVVQLEGNTSIHSLRAGGQINMGNNMYTDVTTGQDKFWTSNSSGELKINGNQLIYYYSTDVSPTAGNDITWGTCLYTLDHKLGIGGAPVTYDSVYEVNLYVKESSGTCDLLLDSDDSAVYILTNSTVTTGNYSTWLCYNSDVNVGLVKFEKDGANDAAKFNIWTRPTGGTVTKAFEIFDNQDSVFYGNVGIGRAPTSELDVYDATSGVTAIVETGLNTADANIDIIGGNVSGRSLVRFGDSDSSSIGYIAYDHSNNSMTFRTSGADQVYIDSVGRIGVNDSVPEGLLHLRGRAVNEPQLIIEGVSTYHATLDFWDSDARVARIRSENDNSNLKFFTNGSSLALTIDSSQNIGIKNSAPTSYWSQADDLVVGDGAAHHGISIVSNSANTGRIAFVDTTGSTPGLDSGGLISYLHSTDDMHFQTAGNEALRINSSQNIGLGGGTDDIEAWTSSFDVIEWNKSSIAAHASNTSLNINSNCYNDGDWKYKTSTTACRYLLDPNGDHIFYVAGAGTLDTVIDWNEAGRFDQDSNLIVNGGEAGTSAEGVFVIGSGTAPTTRPTDNAQMWVEDIDGDAGKAGFHFRNEIAGAQILDGTLVKTTTGDPSEFYDGMKVINTFDNNYKVYADGAFRTIVSW